MLETYRAAIKKMGIDAKLVNDICVGNVLSPSNGYMGQLVRPAFPLELNNAQLARVLWPLGSLKLQAYRQSIASVGLLLPSMSLPDVE